MSHGTARRSRRALSPGILTIGVLGLTLVAPTSMATNVPADTEGP